MNRAIIAIYMIVCFAPLMWLFWYTLHNWPEINELTDKSNEQGGGQPMNDSDRAALTAAGLMEGGDE